MPRVAFIFRTDVHVSERNPSSWKGDYAAEIWSNLTQIGELARTHQVQAVLDGGDYFHIKAASRNSHGLVEKTVRIHQEYPCPVYSVEGNHDLAYNNLDTISRQPLGVLYASGVFHQLRETVFEEGSLKVRVVGVPYSPFRTLTDLKALRKQPGDTHLVAVVHQLAGYEPPADVEDFFGEPVFDYRALVFDQGPDIWMFGHWHKDQGAIEVEGRHFVNFGAVSRGALVKENTERTPKVALVEIRPQGVSIRGLALQVADSKDVFDFDRKDRLDAESTDIAQFVTHLQESLRLDPAANIEDSVQRLEFARDVRDLALHYLELARAEVG